MSASQPVMPCRPSMFAGFSLLRILDQSWSLPAILVIAAVPRIAVLALPLRQTSDFGWYFDRAAGIAHGDGYGVNGVLTAFWPVGWPAALAALFTVTGTSAFAGGVANLVLAILCCWLTAIAGERLTGERTIGRVAALLIAIYPNQIAYVPLLSSEIFYQALLLAGILLLARERISLASGLLAGLVFGVATLTKAQSLVLPGFLLLWVWVAHPSSVALRRSLALGCAVYVALVLVVAPWTYRNWAVFHSFIPVSTNGGWTLLTGNNPQADGGYTPDTELASGLDGQPEVIRDQAARQRGLDWIKANPTKLLTLLPKKVFRLWSGDGEAAWFYERGYAGYTEYSILFRVIRGVNQLYYMLLLITAVPPMLLLLTRRMRGDAWLHSGVALFAFFTFISVVFSGQSRFHFSLMPFIAIYSGWTLYHARSLARRLGWESPAPKHRAPVR